ncbi:histidinol-phosphate transaminase [Desulfitobacterium sp.]|uniref:pyridoxal phosphate-dependent aminotransferase n=1 Tax=Desulfitobacterium sp. TaxID=49981 RepID=UPI002C259A47|nr:histidinol-phosphate transaminase [Desulfitobacterium sp.]HVJ48286.1 histidinol-phosphate transaminase [Desulfitobacterium sp.]
MHGGNLRAAQERYGREKFIDLSANINPFGPPAGVWQCLKRALPEITHYPDPEYKRLTSKLAQQFELSPEQILVGNGAGELLFSLTLALQPKRVLIPVPSFGEYQRAAQAVNAEIRYLTLGVQGWNSLPGVETSEEREEFISLWQNALTGCDLVYLNSPHNPTGSLMGPEQFKLILQIAETLNCWVFFDESFYEFLSENHRWTAKTFLQEHHQLVVLYSMTKFFSLPGIRLGALFAHPETLDYVRKFRDPWSVNVLAEEAGREVLRDSAFPDEVRQKLNESRDFFYNQFQNASLAHLTLHSTFVNFALIEVQDRTAAEVVEKLGALGILVRNCDNFQGLEGQYIRVAIKDKLSMQQLIEGLQTVFSL